MSSIVEGIRTKKTRASKTLKRRKAVEKSTEEKIISAARMLFSKNGFENTRNRDIAKVSGVNLALVNYHFRSKELMYEIIMKETISEFTDSLDRIFNDKKTSLERKYELCVSHFIDRLIKEPDIANFIIDELRNNPSAFGKRLPNISEISNSVIVQQFNQAMAEGRVTVSKNPMVFISNLLALTVFPFLFKPIFKEVFNIDSKGFYEIMEQRKKLVPGWIKFIMFKPNLSKTKKK
jgi:AcrR family transcriptional regulator